jgi:PAS domain-containing protein
MSSEVKQTAVSASNQDLQATQQIIRLFEVAKNEAEESIDRLPGIFLVVNRRGFILRANDYYAEMLKTTVEDALFANLKDIFAFSTYIFSLSLNCDRLK